ncbi:MAG TPA: host attachment protein, partial [Methylophilaceae bacterium]|nr:host attachment protein [Methylophilaceae bacterium]
MAQIGDAMDATWIVVADGARGRIFERLAKGHLTEIDDFVNPVEREDNADLRTDAYGRFYGKGERAQGHTAEPDVSPKQHEAERFAAYIAQFLYEAKNRNRFSSVCLIAAPAFL